jgi:hypothetical protein
MQKARENRSKSLEALLGRLIIQVLLPQVCKFYYKYRRKKKKEKGCAKDKMWEGAGESSKVFTVTF